MRFYADEAQTPVGPMVVLGSDRGVCRVDFGSWQEVSEETQQWAERWYGGRSRGAKKQTEPLEIKLEPGSQAETVRQLEQYFAGERTQFDLTLDMQGTPFQREVWSALQTIAYGETCSYKDIAAFIGKEKAVRAVGGANNRNPIAIIVPCHRVIGRDGSLIGYGGGLHIKQTLLELEQSKLS